VSYLVIARKYRPQTFSDLTGQEHITRTLSRALDQQRLHHAYLFAGVRGTGKTTSARILAKGLNCHQGITSQPCLKCPSCLEIAMGNSLDVLEIDAASNTGVDNVRDVIINNIAMSPARDRYKIFVIDEVHMLSTSAFNALLKTLEEPPAHVIFIMATTELHKLPDTILSRCQQFEFRQIPTEKIFQRLRQIASSEAIKISDEALREIARAGAGSLRDAQSAFDQVIAFGGNEITEDDVTASLGLVSAATLADFAEAIARRDTASIINLIEEVFARGYDLRNFTRELMAYLRHILVIKSGITTSELLGVADVEIARMQQLASHFSEEDLTRCFHLLAETEKEVKDSPHPRFQLELGLVKLAHATRLRTLDELIHRLTELEAKLGSGSNNPGVAYPPSVSDKISPPRSAAGNEPSAKALSIRPSNIESSGNKARPNAEPESAPRSDSLEPPDFPEPDLTVPFDLADSDFGFTEGIPKRKAAPSATTDVPAQPSAPVIAGREVEAIVGEVKALNRQLVEAALDEAQTKSYHDGVFTVTFGKEDVFSKRMRDSGTLFRTIGEKLFGQPIRVEVAISGQVETVVDETVVKRQELKERAMQNPAVRRILDEFRGEIVSVKEVGETNKAVK
jgi:DNA polymerase-3 subunit gamma/tau